MASGATLKDVNFSRSREEKLKQPFEEFEQIHLTDIPETLAPNSGKVILKLVDGNTRNGKLYLDGIDDVINPETGKKERIRLIRGEDEIWQKKQKDLDKDYINKNRISLVFIKGVCILEPTDQAAIKFSELSNCFVGNPKKIAGKKHMFFKWDPAAQEKAAFEKEMFEYEIVQLAMSQPIEKVRKHLVFLGGVSLNDEYGQPRSDEGIRALYLRRAKEIPKRFKDTIDSKEVEVSYLIRKAITDSKIDTAGSGGRIRWAQGGGDICMLPKGRSAYEYLLEFALLPTDEAKTFLKHLQKTV
jgi:hypothetical protein